MNRVALVQIQTGPLLVANVADWLRVVGVTVTAEGTEDVHCLLPLAADGWGILPALGAAEDAIAAYIGCPGAVLPYARVLREVKP